jgi:hypothetical protein
MPTEQARVSARDLTDANALVSGGWCWHGQFRLSQAGHTEAMMRFLFDDDSFSFETPRTAGCALYGGG